MKRCLIYIALLFLFACEEDRSESDQLLVIEGYLYSGAESQQIHLSLPAKQGSNNEVVDDAEVSLYDINNEYHFDHVEDGIYRYDGVDLKIIPGQTYFLEAEYEGQKITAQTTVPRTPVGLEADQDTLVIDDFFSDYIIFSWSNPDFEYYSPLIRSTTSSPDGLINDQVDRFNFSFPLSESEIVVDAFNIEYLGQNELILYSVTDEYLDLYEFTFQEGGLTQPGNIENGLGVFTSFSSDTVNFYVEWD